MVKELCLVQTELVTALCIPETVIWGLAIAFMGILLAVFVPLGLAKKIGITLVIIGGIVAVGFTWFLRQWEINPNFRIMILAILVMVVVLMVLFSGAKKKLEK